MSTPMLRVCVRGGRREGMCEGVRCRRTCSTRAQSVARSAARLTKFRCPSGGRAAQGTTATTPGGSIGIRRVEIRRAWESWGDALIRFLQARIPQSVPGIYKRVSNVRQRLLTNRRKRHARDRGVVSDLSSTRVRYGSDKPGGAAPWVARGCAAARARAAAGSRGPRKALRGPEGICIHIAVSQHLELCEA